LEKKKKKNIVIFKLTAYAKILNHAKLVYKKMKEAKVKKDFFYPLTIIAPDLPFCLGLGGHHEQYKSPHDKHPNLLAYVSEKSEKDVNLCHSWFIFIKPSQVLIHEYTHHVLGHTKKGANATQKKGTEIHTSYYTYEIMIAATRKFHEDGYYTSLGFDRIQKYIDAVIRAE